MTQMAGKRDYYEILEIERTATGKVISDSYRRLAIRFHPDKNPGDDEAVGRFKEAAEAFEVLSDSQKRDRYDRHGHAGVDGNGGNGGSHFSDVGDIFEAFGDMFGGGMFGDIFGGGRGRGGRRVQRGADIRCEVTIDLMEAARGVGKSVEMTRHCPCDDCEGTGAAPGSELEVCRYCGGHGQVAQQSGILRVQTTCPSCRGAGKMVKDPCQSCRGEGFVEETVTKNVMIPAGVDDQMRVRVTGEGEPSPNGGPAGDCYCFIHVTEHPLFRREGGHLICRLPMTYSQAALGAMIEVPTLDGKEEIEIPKGTQPGEVFTLRRRGMPDPRGGAVGDLHVQVQIEVPKKLDREQEELIRQLADHDQVNVTPHRKKFTERLRDFFIPEDDDE